jgi:uncharacterized repeat protein (TIGR03803 family)
MSYPCQHLPRAHSRYLLAILVAYLAIVQMATAQTETVLYSFPGSPDGQYPYSSLIFDAEGNLHGTTSAGGKYDAGTVFEIGPTGREGPLYSFGPLGSNPEAGVIQDSAGNLYGTLVCGGICGNGEAPGAVFKITPAGVESTLGTEGPTYATLVQDASGNLYGTSLGNYPNYGTVFEVSAAWAVTTLYTFGGSPDGASPYPGVIRDAEGNLYGTTVGGGTNGYGTIFEVTAPNTEKILYNFCSLEKCKDGSRPYAGLVQDSAGNLYGTTVNGSGNSCDCGVVFELTKKGNKLIVLHRFTGSPTDGKIPYGGLIMDDKGNLYGTTTYGGASGTGTVFKVTSAHKESLLYNFTGGADGANPYASLVMDAQGNLYGTTTGGGTVNSNCASGCGVVFKVTLP